MSESTSPTPARTSGHDGIDQIGDHRLTGRPASAGPLVFVLCFVLLVAGFWAMAVSFDMENGLVFTGGLVLASLAFLIPLVRAER